MTKLPAGTVHDKIPADLKQVLLTNAVIRKAWTSLTPLARNEWICWIDSAKKPATRTRHIIRTKKELGEGKRRPCCWIGCIHRTDKPLSPSVQGILAKR